MKGAHLIIIFFCTYQLACGQRISFPKRIDGNFIGGFHNANPLSYAKYNAEIEKITVKVANENELMRALRNAKSGDVIYLEGHGSFNLTGKSNIELFDGVSIVSDRGRNRSLGALIFSDDLNTAPLFISKGNNIKLSGIRFRGPDSNIVHPHVIELSKNARDDTRADLARLNSYGVPNSHFIEINSNRNIEIENCEIYNWSYSGILVKNGGDVSVHHCYIHHNQRAGLGYGINIDGAFALIRGNIFDYNRHAIASTGRKGSAYTASYNIAFPNSSNQGHIFDMHGGVDRNDGTNLAGEKIIIYNNLFFVHKNPAVWIRGISENLSEVYENIFLEIEDPKKANSENNIINFRVKNRSFDGSNYVRQSGGKRGNLRIGKNRVGALK